MALLRARVIGAWNGVTRPRGAAAPPPAGLVDLAPLGEVGQVRVRHDGPVQGARRRRRRVVAADGVRVSDDTQAGKPASGGTPRTNDSSESSERARLRSISTGARAAGRSAAPSSNLAAAVNSASCGRASKFGTAAAARTHLVVGRHLSS